MSLDYCVRVPKCYDATARQLAAKMSSREGSIWTLKGIFIVSRYAH